MLRPIPEVRIFVQTLNDHLLKDGKNGISDLQMKFIAICISAMILLGALNFSAIFRGTMGRFKVQALSWMLQFSKISWERLIEVAITNAFRIFGFDNVHIVIDDTDRTRSKTIKAIFAVFKTKDKKTGGFCLAQNIVFLTIVTSKFTLPIFFKFYRPDPKIREWEKENKRLKKKGIKKKDRPPKPERDHENYPTRTEIAGTLLEKARDLIEKINTTCNCNIQVISVLKDAAYMSPAAVETVKRYFPKAQFVSQIAKNQIVWNKTQKKHTVEDYFANQHPIKEVIKLRGEEKSVEYISARLFVQSHGKVLHIIALRYEGESEYRYLAASNLTWRTVDIIKIYALRWLIEVAIEDWKQYDGWGRKASQQSDDGACRGIFLSLLVDCFLLSHPHQVHLLRSGQSLCTTGSLVRRIQFEAIVNNIKEIFDSPDPKAEFQKMTANLDNIVSLRPSSKHMLGKELEDFGPSPNLLYRKTG